MSDAASLQTLLQDSTMVSAKELAVPERNNAVRCLACGHRCRVLPGRSGVCRVRFNEDGVLRAPAGYVAGLQVDPIEKKPFYHAFPGRNALSFGMLGCNLHCSYCQNWITSQALRDDQAVAYPRQASAEQMVALAVEHAVPVIVSTYNEPLITADWAVEIFKLATAEGITCGFVSNGNATPEVLRYIRPFVDLYKVDLKSFDDRHYRSLGGTLDNVLATIRDLVDLGFWVEIVTLVIPGFNDSDEELSQMAAFLAGVSPEVPWHVTAFHPDYKMGDRGRTPAETLARARQIGLDAGLHHVYAGNLPRQIDGGESTRCPQCGAVVIRRCGFTVEENRMRSGQCPDCRRPIAGRWESDPPQRSGKPGMPRPI